MVFMSKAKTYAAVSVISGGPCCDAATALKEQLFLAHGAPALPLADCTDPDRCQCRYEKYADRRNGDDDRRFPYADTAARWFANEDRRHARGRRKGD